MTHEIGMASPEEVQQTKLNDIVAKTMLIAWQEY